MKLFKHCPSHEDNEEEDEVYAQNYWDDLPILVQLHVFEYLDRKSLNNLREVSVFARDVIENIRGIDVIIPERNWAIQGHARPITDSIQIFLLRQMEGKKILTLDMQEMPPSFNPFPFDRFIKHPGGLRELKLKYADIDVLHTFLTQCVKLTYFEYQTGLVRPLPRGPLSLLWLRTSFAPVLSPSTGDTLNAKINGYPSSAHFQLTNLREISLKINQVSYIFKSDWVNIIYFMVAAPPLPTLKRFQFKLDPKMWLSWKTQLLILSCLGEFLGKAPNLEIIKYKSTFNRLGGLEFPEWINISRAIIERWGSAALKEVGEATNGLSPMNSFLTLTVNIFSTTARRLANLRELHLKLVESNEGAVFTEFMRRLPRRNEILMNLRIMLPIP